MVQNDLKTKVSISDKELATLDTFAEQEILQETQLSELMTEEPSFVQRSAIYIISIGLSISFCLLYFGKVPVWVSAKGKIIPKGNSVPVQAIEGGVVKKVLGNVGDRLNKNDPLFVVDRSQSNSNLLSLQRKLTIQKKQLQDLIVNRSEVERIVVNPESFLSESKATSINNSNILELLNNLSSAWIEMTNVKLSNEQGYQEKKQQVLKEMTLAEKKIALLSAQKRNASRNLEKDRKILVGKKRRLEESRSLTREGYLSEIDLESEEERYRTAELLLEENQKQIEELQVEVSNEKLKLSELSIQLQSDTLDTSQQYELVKNKYSQSLNNLRQSLEDINTEIKNLETEIKNNKDKIKLTKSQIAYTSINMPLTGTLAELEVKNSGELVSAGQVVAVILPQDATLIVNAEVPNKDIGFIEEELDAEIKVDAYPFQQFGTISAKVLQVFPNVGSNDNFTITLELYRDFIEANDREIYLFPGLSVEVEIKTRKQRLFELLFSGQNNSQNAQSVQN